MTHYHQLAGDDSSNYLLPTGVGFQILCLYIKESQKQPFQIVSYLTNGCMYLFYREMLFVYEFGFSWYRSQFGNNESRRHHSYKYLWLNIGCSRNLCKNVSTGISLVWISRHVEGLLISMPSV